MSSLWDNFKHSNSCIIRVQKEKRKSKKKQEIGNLFEKLMNENFPSLVKEIDI